MIDTRIVAHFKFLESLAVIPRVSSTNLIARRVVNECLDNELPLVPLQMANIVASYLRDVFGIDARVKWPNDILANGRKIAGILIEARVQEDRAFLIIGTGVNVEPIADNDRSNATSIHELAPERFRGIEDA